MNGSARYVQVVYVWDGHITCLILDRKTRLFLAVSPRRASRMPDTATRPCNAIKRWVGVRNGPYYHGTESLTLAAPGHFEGPFLGCCVARL